MQSANGKVAPVVWDSSFGEIPIEEVVLMIMCTVCRKNYAVVFITKIVNGKQIQEALCLTCAQKQGIEPINQLLEQTGMSSEDVENLNRQITSMFEGMGMDNQEEAPPGTARPFAGNPLFNFFSGSMFQKGGQGRDGHGEQHREADERDGKNSTRVKTQEKKNGRRKKYLELFGTNLNDLARDDKIDRVVGRDREIERVIQILNRRTKNNPVLIGEPGVGKTAIAEGLALRIVRKEVPAKLFNMEVYTLDLAGIVAGTQFRGQFEGRMKGIIEEAKQLGNIILVIDELHNIMGAGEAEGAMNAANILKPALAKGEIQVIGATTLSEYRRAIERDAALERRFQPVFVDEPSVEESIEILRGLKGYYESYHRVAIPDEVIKAAVILSERYITDRYLPDKAIDVIDEAGSRCNLRNEALVKLEELRHELKKVQEEKENAVSADSIEDYQKAADLKVRECKLLKTIKEMEEKSKGAVMTVDDVAYVVESWTKIPVQKLTEEESRKLLNLEERLHRRVIGQHEAVSGLAKAIRRSRAGFRKKRKPASFIFIGPTGVGKTELVKALAVELFGSEEALIRFDMSEYMEKHTVSKLIGSPPGYVGYDDAGQLTEKVRRKPYSIILLDEIEKAHSDVFNILLQILEDGRLTDSHGRTVNFENTIIVMTSNAGTSTRSAGIGFASSESKTAKEKIDEVLKETFRPEFLNRIDEVVVFHKLTKDELKEIVELMLGEVREEIEAKGMKLDVTDNAREFLLAKGYDEKFGARPLRRTIQRYIEDELSELFIRGEIKAGDEITVDLADGEISLKTRPQAAAG